MSAPNAEKWPFSDPQGEANYHAARRAYPAQAIVDLAAIRDNMQIGRAHV